MAFKQSNGVILNKPAGIVGKSTDARSQFYDETSFSYRDYTSTAEVLSYLSGANPTATADVRKGHFPIYVTSGGVTTVYYFKDGTADNNLVPMITGGSATTDASQIVTGFLAPARIQDTSISTSKLASVTTAAIGSNSAAVWGDSLTAGTGGTPNARYPQGTPWMDSFRNKTGYNFYNGGVPGENSTQIRTRMLAATDKFSWPTIIWAGTNNLGSNSTILADIAAMVAALGHQRFLILNLPGHSTSGFWSGTDAYNTLQQLNAALVSAYGPRVVDIRAALVAAYNPSDSQDVADHSHDIIPTSLMASGDAVHFNSSGYEVIAQAVAAKASYLSESGVAAKVKTTEISERDATSPLGIGTVNPNIGRFVTLAIAKPNSTEHYLDGVGNLKEIVLDANGVARFIAPASLGQASQGGLTIKPRFPNEGGFANSEISGTNESVWPSGSGFNFKNHTRDLTLGDTGDVALKHKGTYSITGNITSGGLTTGGIVNFSGGKIHNLGTFTSDRGLPLDIVGSRGIGIPTLTTTQSAAVGGGGPYTEGLPLIGELSLNTTQNRLQFGYNKYDPYSGYAIVPIMEDIPVLINGAGISIAQSGRNYTITNTTLPATSKLTTSAIYASSEPNPTNNAAKAFDGDTSTYYQSAANDQDGAPYIGVTLTNQSIITKVRIFAADGLTIQGGKIQGSNTSTTTGFADIYTLPATTYYQFVDFNISSTTPYKYIRILGNSANYVLAVKEIEFYGYQSIDLSVANGSALTLNSTTKVLDLPAATNSISGYLTALDHAAFAGKQDALISGNTIKTINGQSILGSGDITITGGGGTGTTPTTNAADLTSGTLSDLRLSTNVPLKNTANTFSENITVVKNYAGSTNFTVTNTSNAGGVAAAATFNNGATTVQIGVTGTGVTPYGALGNDQSYVYSGGNSGLAFISDNPSGAIVFSTGGAIEKMRLSSSGNLQLQVGDFEVSDPSKGYILKSPNGSKWRIRITDAGAINPEPLP